MKEDFIAERETITQNHQPRPASRQDTPILKKINQQDVCIIWRMATDLHCYCTLTS
jgi:hypothetical protein